MGKFAAPATQLHDIENIVSPFIPLILVYASDFERQSDVVDDRSMRHQSEVLEHHPDLFVAKRLQRLTLKRHDILPVDQNLSERWLEKTVYVSDQG